MRFTTLRFLVVPSFHLGATALELCDTIDAIWYRDTEWVLNYCKLWNCWYTWPNNLCFWVILLIGFDQTCFIGSLLYSVHHHSATEWWTRPNCTGTLARLCHVSPIMKNINTWSIWSWYQNYGIVVRKLGVVLHTFTQPIESLGNTICRSLCFEVQLLNTQTCFKQLCYFLNLLKTNKLLLTL